MNKRFMALSMVVFVCLLYVFAKNGTIKTIHEPYDIIGKWKSVGDSGFGQAQPGAIVVFDGNRCNFYSPSDTYAFYFDGDKYVLDLTTPLGESLERTVNIIDDDNIKIAGASLTRIE